MNRLHLPPPFGDPDLFPGNLRVISEEGQSVSQNSEPSDKPVDVTKGIEPMDLSGSSESELSSDQDDQSPVSVPQPRTALRQSKRPRTHGSSHGLAQSTVATRPNQSNLHSGSLSDVFDAPTSTSKLNLLIPQRLVPSGHKNIDSAQVGGFGVLHAPSLTLPSASCVREKKNSETFHDSLHHEFQLRKTKLIMEQPENIQKVDHVPSPDTTEQEDESQFVQSFSLNELYVRRLTAEERQNYTVFSRNYSPGDPTSRLYIKNLSSSVTEEDLYRIFGAFQFGPVKDLDFRPLTSCNSTERFSIRLLTSGRMKGQAFVSLSCEVTAAQALEATNGLLLHDKPMVVQFARGSKAKVDEKSLISVS